MLAATIASGTVSAPVRIRNLSNVGAMIDGPALPERGSSLMLNRLEMSVAATVVWNHDGRCGLSLRAPIAVDDWIAGVRAMTTTASLGQLRVDRIQSAIRGGAPLPSDTQSPTPLDAEAIDQRIATELARVRRMLDKVSEELTEDVDIVARHQLAMQNFDIAATIVEEISAVMAADDRAAAVGSVQMHDLRSRLSGRQTLT